MNATPDATGRAPRSSAATIVGALAAVLVGAFVTTSTLIAVLPTFRFESQFPAILPFFAWAGAAGVGHLANLARSLHVPWRDAHGYVSLVPYVLLMLTTAAVPDLELPWWLCLVAAAAAVVPFLLLAARPGTRLAIDPVKDADTGSLRGTFLIGIALMLMAYAVSGPTFAGAVLAVLLAVGLTVVSMMTHGLARASRTWRLRHWAALAWGCLAVWGSVLLHGTTSLFGDPWFVLSAVVFAGVPLIVVNSAESRRLARS